jgi:hypothetical protein
VVAPSERTSSCRRCAPNLPPKPRLGSSWAEPCPHAGSNNMLGIDDDALQAPGGIAVDQPETRRRGSNLGRIHRLARAIASATRGPHGARWEAFQAARPESAPSRRCGSPSHCRFDREERAPSRARTRRGGSAPARAALVSLLITGKIASERPLPRGWPAGGAVSRCSQSPEGKISLYPGSASANQP